MNDQEKNYKKLQRRVYILEQAVEALLERDHQYLRRLPAFNDQQVRISIFEALLKRLNFDFIAETGTKWGNTTNYLAGNTGQTPIYSCELIRESFLIARERLKHYPLVSIENMDSRSFLSQLIASGPDATAHPFFYLDAHWYDDLPLLEEVQAIAGHWQNYTIMVDDFKDPNDSGYGYDDYGNGKALTLEYLSPAIKEFDIKTFFPAAPATEETGACRGTAVLCGPGTIHTQLQSESLLAEYQLTD